MYWGYTPAINVFKDISIDPAKDDRELNVLLSECGGDARHLLKSVADILPMANQKQQCLNFYVHEKNKENLARLVLFLTLICETGLSQRERMEMFLDLYANTLIRDKTSSYLETTTKELIQLITEDEKCTSVLKDLVNFDNLKFKERDEIEDIFSSYLKKHPFDIEKLRDQRLRAHFKERYDNRRNLVDWDYSMNMKDYAPTVNHREYRDWRMNGIAFETRLATGTISNRTMGSYIPGKTKKGYDSIMVRGFWGDTINSPFIAFGQEVWKEPERTRFFKQVNY